ncbi:glycosyl transferase family protein [Sphingopyxis sp.]|uniref:glycosyl transferase family protein n=1 Tax=Sphingopyxis sp. TaxID=1908224 RepID=UPI003D0E8FAC
MEWSSAGLQWLVQGAGYELMLFASVGILLIGIDDLLFDLLWLSDRWRNRGRGTAPFACQPVDGTLAVFIPAWDEERVLATTLTRMLAAWHGEDVRLYVGCYPNDIGTLLSVSPLVARDPRLRLVVGPADGPTTKGDNLNRLWAALGEDERAEGMRFAGVVLHDSEDHVHPAELALYRAHLADHAMVQIPVVPFVTGGSRWIGGHYGDEFAEAHGKELALRSRLGVALPSAGVGCALTRSALALLAIERGGHPFRADSLTEDYEVGMLIGAYGLRSCFVDAITADGERIVSRGAFPGSVERAVRQKSRWITGIALAGWDHLGWLGVRVSGGDIPPARLWLARWMLWRDRRSPLAALVVLAAYGGLLLTGLALAGEALFGWQTAPTAAAMRLLFGLNAALLLWRLAMRFHFTARCYGLGEAMFALPRAFIANVIAILAARRAVTLYWRMLRSGEIVWEKTEHWDGDALPAVRVAPR